MLISKRLIPLYLIIALMLVSLLDQIIPGTRYAKYLILPLSIAFIFDRKLKLSSPPGLQAFYLYFLTTLPYLAISTLYSTKNTIDDTIFLLTYLLPLTLIADKKISIKGIFSAVSIFFMLNSAGKLGSGFTIDITTSTSSFEHSEFGFIFAFFLVYFVVTKDFKLALLALLLTMLSLKRIALVGATVALMIYYLKPERMLSRTKIALIAATINVLIIFLIRFSVTDEFNDLVFSLTDQSSNEFMMGRVKLYSYILDSTSINWLYGLGPGGVYSYASSAFESTNRVLLHSDVLKLAIEYGVLFLFAFIYLLYKDKRAPLEQIVLLNIIMLTDNPLIYAAVMFMLFLLIASPSSSQSPKSTQTTKPMTT